MGTCKGNAVWVGHGVVTFALTQPAPFRMLVRKKVDFARGIMSGPDDGRKRRYEHINTEEDVLVAAADILRKRVWRGSVHGGRGYEGLNRHLLVDAATFYPVAAWKEVFKLAAARTDVAAELNVARHAAVLDRSDTR